MKGRFRLVTGFTVLVVVPMSAITAVSAVAIGGPTATPTPTGNMSDDAMATETMTNESMADGNSSSEDLVDESMTNSSTNESMDDGMTQTMTDAGMDDEMTETAMADDTTDAEMQDTMADTAVEKAGQTETSNPGFGIAVAVIAILAIAGLAFRRRM